MPFRVSHIVPFALAATLLTSSKLATGNAADAKNRYKKDRAACLNLQASEKRDVCLNEAAAAYRAGRNQQAVSAL